MYCFGIIKGVFSVVKLKILIVQIFQNKLPLLTNTKIVTIHETHVLNFDKKAYYLIQYR
jgi:hypothetical protein